MALAQAFNFGGFNLPIPSFPFIDEIPTLPADLASLLPDKIPSFAFNRTTEFPSIPELPSMPPMPSIDFDSYRTAIPDYKSLVPTAVPDVNDILKSLDITPFPTIRVPSRLPLIPTLDDFGFRDNDLMDFWRRNHTLKVPESEQELRDFIGNRTKFDFNRADALVDRLSDEVGTDVRPSIRMIAGLVLNNQSFDQVYKRATTEFTFYSQRIRESTKTLFNFTNTQVGVPSIDLANRTLSVIRYVQNPYTLLSDQKLNSSVVSIMVADLAGNETRIRDLPELLNFTLPVDGMFDDEHQTGACVYWNETVTTWATDGCQLLKVLDGVATCGCNHLTDFAFIASEPRAMASPSISQSVQVTPTYLIVRPVGLGPVFAVAEAMEPTPNGTSPLVIGLASAGAILGVVGIVAIYMNIKYGRKQRIKSMRAEPSRWAYLTTHNLVTQVVVKP